MGLLMRRPLKAEIERLQNLSMTASDDLEKATQENKQLHFKLDREGPNLYPEDFATLKARVEQSDMRVAQLQVTARQRQKELDDERAVEQAKIDRQAAQDDYDATVRQFERISKTLVEQTKQLQELKSSFDFGTETRNRLLREIAEKRDLLRDLGVAI